ncbi:MAG: helix-turn-helix domain-containing protein [Microcoleaceae cyanobacterium]
MIKQHRKAPQGKDHAELGRQIRELMEASEISQRDIASALKLSQSSVSRRLQGIYHIDVIEFFQILEVIGYPLTIDQLLSALKKKKNQSDHTHAAQVRLFIFLILIQEKLHRIALLAGCVTSNPH